MSCVLLGYLLLRTPEHINFLALPWFINDKSHFVPLAISGFSSGNIPQIEIKIEAKTIKSKVDLGWDGGIVLPKEVLHSLRRKSFIKKKSFFGMRGKSYESDIYELPDIQIGEMTIFPMWAEEKNDEFVKDGILTKGTEEIPEEHLGKAGWRVFKPFNLLLDCDHSIIIICDSLATAKQQGYPIDGFIEAPLLLDRDSIDFEVITEAGPLRCMLDTGSTWNLLNKKLQNPNHDHRLIDLDHLNGKPPEFNLQNEDLLSFNTKDHWETKIFQINKTEFGAMDFLKIQSPLGLDAIIGMEFIDEHLIFIDFRNEKIYFSKLPEERSPLVRAYDFLKTKIRIHS